MSLSIQTLFSAVALSLAALSANAQPADGGEATATPRIDARQARQQARIAQGVASGALTPREQHRLQHQQRHIQRAETVAQADGQVSTAERRRLTRLQDRASRDIRRQKHDAQTRPAS